MTPHPDTPEDDIVRYVLGEMSLDEQVAFEVRMAEDDALGRAVTAAMVIDEHLGLARSSEGITPHPTAPVIAHRRTGRLVAAATLAVLALGAATWAWRTWRGAVHEIAVAVVPTSMRYEQLLAELDLPAADAPAEAMRGDGPTLPDGPARVDDLLRRADAQLQRAVAAPMTEVRGEAFVVPLRNQRELWVAIVGTFDDGSGQVYFPADNDVEAARRAGLVPPGNHVLPAPRATASPEQRERGIVAFAPGFVVPRRRDSVTVLVLTMPSAPDASRWQRVHERMARTDGDLRADLNALLPEASCSTFVVRTR